MWEVFGLKGESRPGIHPYSGMLQPVSGSRKIPFQGKGVPEKWGRCYYFLDDFDGWLRC
jgi:hypothetical protein